MKRIVITFFLCALSCGLFAQTPGEVTVTDSKGDPVFSYKADTADLVMRRTPAAIMTYRQKDPAEFIRLLAEYINEKAVSVYDKVKKAHDWVAIFIKYDTQSYFSGRYASQGYDSVLKRGMAVCAGYAQLFKMICDALNIECRIVEGYARGYSSNVFNNELPINTNHDWNIVTIDGKQFLLDCTWDSGYVDGWNFVNRYKSEYFFADPKIFIYEHFPENKANQLLEKPLSAQEFAELPFLELRFLQSIESHPELLRINEVEAGEELSFEFTAKPRYGISYRWISVTAGTVAGPVYSGRTVRVNMPKLKPGKYILRISIQNPGENIYWQCAQYGFIVK